MHRRRSLGVGLLVFLMFFVGSVSVSAEPQAAPESRVVESLDLLDWAWEWIRSLVSSDLAGSSEVEPKPRSALEFGPFMDPNGND